MDFFITSDLFEEASPSTIEDGLHGRYQEQLVRLEGLTTYFDPQPEQQSEAPLALPSLPPDPHVYTCLQSLMKIHPSFDDVIQVGIGVSHMQHQQQRL